MIQLLYNKKGGAAMRYHWLDEYLWRSTRDPSLSDAAFEADLQQRISALRDSVCSARSVTAE